MFEAYRLTLTHYAVNEVTGEKFKLDDPIATEQMFDRRYGGSPIILNRMFDKMKSYVLEKMNEVEK
jgi:hypothetical protein